MNNHNPSQNKTQLKDSADVSSVVQEYMDSLLVDLFPDVIEEQEPEVALQETSIAQTVEQAITLPDTTTVEVSEIVEAPVEVEQAAPVIEQQVAEPKVQVEEKIEVTAPEVKVQTEVKTEAKETTETKVEVPAPQKAPEVAPKLEEPQTEVEVKVAELPKAKPKELRYPNAPEWAQQPFDVLLFDVCGLKLAVPMESLGKIIKVEHETNHLIGRPNWFIGAYNENEQSLYVVDTAQYIMPEKGFNLAEDGYEFIIQLQRSPWTLACKKVYSTVRLEPDQVKWRSQHGKRLWLSGTVIDHMCALIHVDSLISLLEAEAS